MVRDHIRCLQQRKILIFIVDQDIHALNLERRMLEYPNGLQDLTVCSGRNVAEVADILHMLGLSILCSLRIAVERGRFDEQSD